MSIRRARVHDVPALVALEQSFDGDRLSARSFRHLVVRGHADVWLSDAQGQVQGNAVVLYRTGTRSARLYSLVVGPKARGRGLGRALLIHAERSAARRGWDVLHLEVRADNAAALRLYESAGYRVIQRLDRYYEDGGAGLRLRKTLLPTKARRARAGAAAYCGNASSRGARATARAPIRTRPAA